jgi:hypothetical protein
MLPAYSSHVMSSMRVSLAFVVVLALVGCQDRTDVRPTFVVDTLASGTVRVQNLEPDAPSEPTGISLRHVVRVGSIEGDEVTSFGRVVDALVGPDEVVFVLDAQAKAARMFDLTGNYLGTLGGPGRGPGELRSPYSLVIDEEGRIWVADAGNRRFSVFEKDGVSWASRGVSFRGGIGRGSVRIAQDRLWDLSMLMDRSEGPDGSVQVRSLGIGALGLALEDALVPRDTIPLGIWSPTGLTRVSGSERLTMIPPYAPRRVMEFSRAGSLWIGIGDRYEIHEVVPGGDTVRILTRESVSPYHFDEEASAFVGEWFRSTKQDGFDGDESVVPTVYPLFSRISADEDGFLWVFRDLPGENSTEIDVFDPDGRFRGTVSASIEVGAKGTNPRIFNGYLVGTSVDPLGVQYVEVFRVSTGL